MDINQESLELHYQMHGKIEVISRKKIETRKDLSLLYTPGVAEPCRQIAKDYEKSFELTRRNNLVAVIKPRGQLCRPGTFSGTGLHRRSYHGQRQLYPGQHHRAFL